MQLFKTVILCALFFTLTPLTLIIGLFSLLLASPNQNQPQVLAESTQKTPDYSGVEIFASLPEELPSVGGEAKAVDARVELLRKYLKNYNSPLERYAEKIVHEADKYAVDFRLITAIAQQESNLCKFIPPETYNCWGWGIHSQGTLGFESYEDGIKTVTKGLREKYLDEGLITVEQIMGRYTPMSPGSWAIGVNTFMSQMQ